MTAAKIAISLPRAQLSLVRAAVKRGEARSVSMYVTQALERRQREDSLAALVADLIAEHGAPSAEDEAWAARALPRKHRR